MNEKKEVRVVDYVYLNLEILLKKGNSGVSYGFWSSFSHSNECIGLCHMRWFSQSEEIVRIWCGCLQPLTLK